MHDVKTISVLSGGRNGFDAPTDIPDGQCVEALNVEWDGTPFGRKRNGATATSWTYGANVRSLVRHVPALDESAAELWAINNSGTIERLSSGALSSPTLKDSATLARLYGATLNGRLALMYDNAATNRAHIWDTATVRRLGLGMKTNGQFSNQTPAAGAITDSRHYKFRLLEKSGSTIVRRSEASTPVTSVDLIAEQYTATVASPASNLPDEGETHWELWAASQADSAKTIYRYIGEAAIGATVTDNNASLTGLEAEPLAGTYALPPSAKWVIADDARFVMAGAYETAITGTWKSETVPKSNRVWWTPVLGDLDVSDDERIVNTTAQKNYLDVEEAITGLARHDGAVYVFSARSIWKLTPTGDVTRPYVRTVVSRTVGAVTHQSIINGEDENGHDALYFMSLRGPYRIGTWLEYCGHDVQDLMPTYAEMMDIAHGVYYAAKRQVWFWLAPAASGYVGVDPVALVFTVSKGIRTRERGVIGGWAKYTGPVANALCSGLYGAVSGSVATLRLSPHIGSATTSSKVYICDVTATTSDNGTAFQAYVEAPPKALAGPQRKFTVQEPTVVAQAGSATVEIALIRDFGAETRTATVTLAAVGSETRVAKRVEDAAMDDAKYLGVRVGDASATASAWTIDHVTVPVQYGERW